MAGLYCCYLGSWIFLLLETLIILTNLTSTSSLRLLSSPWCLLCSGLASPLLYTILAFSILRPHLLEGEVSLCWADVTSPRASLFLVPVILLSLASIPPLVLSYPRPQQDTPRSLTLATNRHSVMMIVLLVSLVTSLGPVVHTVSTFSGLVCVSYQLARLGLAVAVIVRTLTDTQVSHQSHLFMNGLKTIKDSLIPSSE